MMIACEKGDVEIARTLLNAGADINATSKMVSLWSTAEGGCLLLTEAALYFQKQFGSTALSRACRFGHMELVIYLLKGGFTVDINIQSKVSGQQCSILKLLHYTHTDIASNIF